ncbi:MAG: hypothetical protein P1V21_01315 [Rhizobiaceae bacterium]|nr:hypothetical protein [Rhizobiaceae bacterium]
MSDTIRLRIITNNPARALMEEVLGVTLEDRPNWCVVLTTPQEVAAIPEGALCYAVFYLPTCRGFAARETLTPLESAWLDRRARGGVQGLGASEFQGMRAWRQKRNSRAKQETTNAGQAGNSAEERARP